MAYQSGQERRTDPYRTDPYGHPGVRPHELGTAQASSRAGWVVGVILLVLIGLIVLGAMAGGGPDATDAPPAATAPATAPATITPSQPGTDMTPAPAPAPVE
jgi:hypothetical protein